MPRSQALRKGRYSGANLIYVVTTVCAQRRPLFASFHNARLLVQSLREAEVSATTLCFVVMPDHLHWMLQLKAGEELSTTVRFVKAETEGTPPRHWAGVAARFPRPRRATRRKPAGAGALYHGQPPAGRAGKLAG